MVTAVLLALAAVGATPAESARFSLDELGFPAAARQRWHEAEITLAVPGRSDRVLTAATLSLTFARRDGLGPLEVAINHERVALLDPTAPAPPVVIDPALLGAHNTLTLRLVDRRAAGPWEWLSSGVLSVESTPLKLPDDLGLLPLPFFDPGFDRHGRLAVAFLRAPTPGQVRAAALVASWVGLRGGDGLRFAVSTAPPVDGNAIVLAEGGDAARLGLPPPSGPALHLVERPRGGKLLVLLGRDEGELALAALALSDPTPRRGDSVPVTAMPAAPTTGGWAEAASWIPLRRLSGGDRLVHQGTGRASLRIGFRLPPDLFFWHDRHSALVLAYDQTLPPGLEPARVDLELDGRYLGTLRPRAGRGQARFPIPVPRLAGYEELVAHIDYERGESGGARLAIDVDRSGFTLPGFTHFAALPNLGLFVDDGFPFTRRPDLGETLAVLPDQPAPAEIATLLSVVAALSSITARPASGLMVAGASQVIDGAHRDLLLIGAGDRLPFSALASEGLPLRWPGPVVRRPGHGAIDALRSVLTGRTFDGEEGRARDTVAHLPSFAAAVAYRSPLDAGRDAVAITASALEEMPPFIALQGHAESRTPAGDLLLAVPGRRWMYRLGPGRAIEPLPPWPAIELALTAHWVALGPTALLGIALGISALRGALASRARRRTSGPS
jgi:hypothetical protein